MPTKRKLRSFHRKTRLSTSFGVFQTDQDGVFEADSEVAEQLARNYGMSFRLIDEDPSYSPKLPEAAPQEPSGASQAQPEPKQGVAPGNGSESSEDAEEGTDDSDSTMDLDKIDMGAVEGEMQKGRKRRKK